MPTNNSSLPLKQNIFHSFILRYTIKLIGSSEEWLMVKKNKIKNKNKKTLVPFSKGKLIKL